MNNPICNKATSIVLFGDFAPYLRFEKICIEKRGGVFGEALDIIKNAGLSYINLECPLTNERSKASKSGPNIKASPECAHTLDSFTAIGLANNHILDYGITGLIDTIKALDNHGLHHIGAGLTSEEADAPFTKLIDGVNVSILALAEHEFNVTDNGHAGASCINIIKNYHTISDLKKNGHVVLVTIHAGVELSPYPRPGLREICKFFIEAGAEAIICHHPHVPGAFEYYLGKPIVYSLGNVIFDGNNKIKEWWLGYFVDIKINTQTKNFESMTFIPYEQSPDIGGLRLLEGLKKQIFMENILNMSEDLKSEEKYLALWSELVKRNGDRLIISMFFPFLFKGINLLAKYIPIKNILLAGRGKYYKLNMLQCQSHFEVLKTALEKHIQGTKT